MNGTSALKRQRRYLLFTSGSQYGTYVTVSIPLHPFTTTSVAWFIEASYYNVANATYFDPLLGDISTMSRTRDKRDTVLAASNITRFKLYTFFESMLEKHGYSGRACLLRAICENASSHFLHNGVLGDVLHLMLTPSTSMSEDDIDDCYYEAEFYGLEENCAFYFKDCPESPLEYISINLDEFTQFN